MTDQQLDKLEALAQKATQGPWLLEVDQFDRFTINHKTERGKIRVANLPFFPWAENDAKYIAAANPEAILDLIRDYRALKKAVAGGDHV